MRKKVAKELIKMGIPMNLKGFHYICDAMEMYEQDNEYITSNTCILYQKIAEKNGTTYQRVERNIRHAFEVAVKHGNINSLDECWNPAQRTTNKNLLAYLYMKLKDMFENG